jgi:C4-dicarboxylate-specific signal transduction histidine kinase
MDIEIPVPGELVPEIIEQSVLISDSIETLSFGRISRESSETLMKSMGCRMAAAIALHNGTDLLGMAAAYLPGVSTGVPLEALKTFAYMAGLALTRKKTEEEITRLNRDLEKKVEQRTGELRVAYDDIVNTNRELEKAMRELRETQHQLVQAEKLTALGQLAAGIAHELNTPLGSIMSSNRSMIVMMQQKLMETVRFMAGLNDKELAAFDTLVKEAIEHASRIGNPPGRKIKREIAEILAAAGIKRPDELVELIIDSGVFGLREKLVSAVRVRRRKEILEAVQAVASARRLGEVIAIATEKAVHVVNALQNYLRQDMDEEFTGVDVRSEMETILMLYHNKIKQGVTVVKRFDTGDRVLGNRDKLNQLWMNLLNNALQAIDYRGTVEIAAERREEWIVVSVIDSGPGVPEDIRDRIFEPFFTTKGHGEGMGLGLDISRKIAEKHGGRIELETEPGRTKFSVWLKAVDTSV